MAMIRTRVDGDVRTVVLDRPERRNALTGGALRALSGAIDAATEPVLYLRGAGEAFSAGADLEMVSSLESEADARAFIEHGQQVANALAGYEGVTVAGVDGPARGGGVELALACDVRVATPAATFAETGVDLGLFGAWGGTHRLPAIVGRGVAMDITLSGRVVDAEAALRMGLVSRILERPHAAATEIATADAQALRRVKTLLAGRRSPADQEAREAEAFAALHAAADFGNRNG
jgi:enoyl-CoA hydratase